MLAVCSDDSSSCNLPTLLQIISICSRSSVYSSRFGECAHLVRNIVGTAATKLCGQIYVLEVVFIRDHSIRFPRCSQVATVK